MKELPARFMGWWKDRENQIILPKGSKRKAHRGVVEGPETNSCFMKDLDENCKKHI